MVRSPLVPAAMCLLLAGCSTEFTPQTCATDDACGSGLVCEVRVGQPVCVAATDAALHIGSSAPLSGPNQALGTDMKLGMSLAFDAPNAAGGIRGRQLVLDFRDDAYDPDTAEANVRALLDVQPGTGMVKCPSTDTSVVAGQAPVSTTPLDRGPNAVLALLGNVGTPTMVLTAPVTLETGTLFFGAFTGATPILRDTTAGPCHQYVFNVRASYADEARAALEYFFDLQVPDYTHILSFDQNDTYGQAGYSGLVAAYTAIKGGFTPPPADPTTPFPRFRYTRNDETTVPAQVTAAAAYLGTLLAADTANHTIGILMTDTYGPAADFITGLRQWQYANDAQQTMLQKATRLTLDFINVSFVGPNALAARLQQAGTVAAPQGPVAYTASVIVSQVVPNYQSDSSDGVLAYNKAVLAAGATPSFTSLEGYIDAQIFIAGLLAHAGPFSPEPLVAGFEDLASLSLGLGASAGFSSTSHNYSKTVWGTALNASAGFQNQYFWSEGVALQMYQ